LNENGNTNQNDGKKMALYVILIMVIHFAALVIGQYIALGIYTLRDLITGTLKFDLTGNIFQIFFNEAKMQIYDYINMYTIKSAILGNIISAPLLVMGFWLFCRKRKEKFFPSASIYIKPPVSTEKNKIIKKSFLGLLTGISVYFPIAYIISNTFIGNLSPETNAIFESMSSTTPLWLLILSIGIFAPIMEELTFRGFIQNKLGETGKPYAAVIIQALLFGAFHMNLQQFLYAAVIGIIFGFIKLWSGSIWPCILAHIGFNVFSAVLEKSVENFEAVNDFIVDKMVFILVASVALFAAVFYIFEKEGRKKV